MEAFERRAPGAGARLNPGAESGREADLAIAHDFRNMLQLAVSAVSVTRRRLLGRSDPGLETMLDVALDSLERAGLLAQRLVSPAERVGTAEPVLIQSLLVGLRPLLRHMLGETIRLETFVTTQLAPVLCDPHQLENVLLNLSLNARDAMPAGGVLVLGARHCNEASHHGRCIAVSATDTGTGMPEEVAARAFQAGFTTKCSSGGSGLGLHNVWNFAAELGGSAEIVTSEDSGTRVCLHLPAMSGAGPA